MKKLNEKDLSNINGGFIETPYIPTPKFISITGNVIKKNYHKNALLTWLIKKIL